MSKRALSSALRILSATGGSLVVLSGLAALLVTQPTFQELPFRGLERAEARHLRRHVEFLTIAAAPRDSDHPESLDRAAAYIRDEFSRTRARVREQVFTARGRPWRNVIASYGPDRGPLLVVGAHYDAFGGFGANPGADDNASGTAGLLELARLLQEIPLEWRVELVAFTNEEPPFFASPWMGSAVHARSLQSTDVEGMICLEMIGYFSEKQAWPHPFFRWLYPDRGDFIGVVGRWSDAALTRRVERAMRGGGRVPVLSFNGPRALDIDASDQRNYWDAGYAAVMITDTAFLRNPHYHTPGDRAGTLDYERMAGVVDGVLNAVLHMAG
jgi:hypothetical protein